MQEDNIIHELLNKPILSPNIVQLGRFDFYSNLKQVEIDITYDCNLKCKCCNRSCGNAPSKEMMSVEDINFFIQDSKKNDRKYNLINILGGEPTLHQEFEKIIKLLQEKYADDFCPDVIIQIVSNGFTQESRDICDKVESIYKNVRIDRESYKSNSNVDFFTPFSDAPLDDEQFKDADYSRACWVAERCGIGLNINGYFGCAVCGAIDRILNTKKGVKSIAQLTPEIQKSHFNFFCGLCGNFKYYEENLGETILRCEKPPFKEIVSPTWEKIYKDYNTRKNKTPLFMQRRQTK